MEFPSQTVQSWLGNGLRPDILATEDLRVILRSIDGRSPANSFQLHFEKTAIFDEALNVDTTDAEEPSTDILKFSHSCLYEQWDPLIIPEVENNLGNLSGLCVHENIHKRLSDVKDAWSVYLQFMSLFNLSDKADYWAFFYQNWNLLRPSFQLKLKITNALLSEFPKGETPPISSLQFTQVLTRQSSMYNTWKQMVKFSDEQNISIEDIPRALNTVIRTNMTPNQLKKLEIINIPKSLCNYTTSASCNNRTK